MKTFIKEITWLSMFDHGFGNGYVILPVGHKYHSVHYDDIDISVHGGLTLSEPANECEWPEIAEEDKEGWIIGFDTGHFGDTLQKWTKSRVQEELDNLVKQLEL